MDMILRAALAATVLAGLSACAPTSGIGGVSGGTGPQFAADDPCQGVVPELCASPSPIVDRTPGEPTF